MTTLYALATFHGFTGNPEAYKAKLVKRQKNRARNAVKRANGRNDAWLKELDRLARVKAEARKLDNENRLRAIGSARPIPNCLLRSKRIQNDMDASAWSWMAFGKPFSGAR